MADLSRSFGHSGGVKVQKCKARLISTCSRSPFNLEFGHFAFFCSFFLFFFKKHLSISEQYMSLIILPFRLVVLVRTGRCSKMYNAPVQPVFSCYFRRRLCLSFLIKKIQASEISFNIILKEN